MLNAKEKVFLGICGLDKSEKATHEGQLSLRLFSVAVQSIPDKLLLSRACFRFL